MIIATRFLFISIYKVYNDEGQPSNVLGGTSHSFRFHLLLSVSLVTCLSPERVAAGFILSKTKAQTKLGEGGADSIQRVDTFFLGFY